jgi:hypothetical protein
MIPSGTPMTNMGEAGDRLAAMTNAEIILGGRRGIMTRSDFFEA